MSRLLFEARAAVLAMEAQERVLDKEIELAKLKAAQRQWVGLTREEILNLGAGIVDFEYAAAIEAKLREKNGGQA